MEGRNVKLVSRDDVEFVLSVEAAKESRFVANSLSLDDDSPEDAESDLRVDVIRVSGGCLGKVVAFLKHFKEEPMAEITMPLPGPTFEDVSALMLSRSRFLAGTPENLFVFISLAIFYLFCR